MALTLYTWIEYFVILLWVTPYVKTACNFGPDCIFPCNCDNECDQITGKCADYRQCKYTPAYGDMLEDKWSGQGCQVGNVALGKKTFQNGQYGSMSSHKAVDGNSGFADPEGYCAFPYSDDPDDTVSWTVDLGSLYRINSIHVYNTQDDKNYTLFQKINVLHSRYNNETDYLRCSVSGQLMSIGQGQSSVLACPVVARYIRIQTTANSPQTNKLPLCEVQVHGYKYVEEDFCNNCAMDHCEKCPKDGSYCTETQHSIFCDSCRAGTDTPLCPAPCDTSTCDCTRCDCSRGSCGQCQKWFFYDGSCDNSIKYITVKGDQVDFKMERVTVNSMTVTFKQVETYGLDPGAEQFYYYEIVYEKAEAQKPVTYATIQHVGSLISLKTVVIDGLDEFSFYTVTLNINREYTEKNWKQTLGTVKIFKSTLCGEPGDFDNVSMIGGIKEITVRWSDLGFRECHAVTRLSLIYSNGTVFQALPVTKGPTSHKLSALPGSYSIRLTVLYLYGTKETHLYSVTVLQSTETNTLKPNTEDQSSNSSLTSTNQFTPGQTSAKWLNPDKTSTNQLMQSQTSTNRLMPSQTSTTSTMQPVGNKNGSRSTKQNEMDPVTIVFICLFAVAVIVIITLAVTITLVQKCKVMKTDDSEAIEITEEPYAELKNEDIRPAANGYYNQGNRHEYVNAQASE